MPETSFRVIRARDNSSVGIAEAFTEAARSTPLGLFGPINPPMILIPGEALQTATGPIIQERRARSAKPWCPSFEIVGGCAATYGTTTLDPSGHAMTTAPFAFAAAIRDGEIFCTINHDEDLRIASRMDGSLRLWETASGLFFEVNPFANPDARRLDVLNRAQRGEFIGASMRYSPEWSATRSANGARMMMRANYVIEVSLIAKPHTPNDRRTWISTGRSGHLQPRRIS